MAVEIGLDCVRIGYIEPREDLALEVLHLPGGSIRLMIVAQEVQEAMHRKMGKMMGERSCLGLRLADRGLVRDGDVAEVSGCEGGRRGSREAKDVGRAVDAPPLPI